MFDQITSSMLKPCGKEWTPCKDDGLYLIMLGLLKTWFAAWSDHVPKVSWNWFMLFHLLS